MRWLASNIVTIEENYERTIYLTDLVSERGDYEQTISVILRKRLLR